MGCARTQNSIAIIWYCCINMAELYMPFFFVCVNREGWGKGGQMHGSPNLL